MNNKNFIGWDVGGAHLKVASVDESGNINFVHQFASPLWKGMDCLEQLFPEVIKQLPPAEHCFHALTVTAELADIFVNRIQGLQALLALFVKKLDQDVLIYARNHGLLNVEQAKDNFMHVASANWHVSSRYVASVVGTGVFIDVGSTTTDIIPFQHHKLINSGFDDQTRLRFDELVYTGVTRTALMALAEKAPFAGEWQNVVAENFATTADIYRLLSCLHEADDLMETADGKGKDIGSSIQRLARMIGADNDGRENTRCWYSLAEYFREKQLQLISTALLRVLSSMPKDEIKLLTAGMGSFLSKEIARRVNLPCLEFSSLCKTKPEYKHQSNVCAPAIAVAQLNRQLTLNNESF